jgi:membrane-associated phospholipid phosphatase
VPERWVVALIVCAACCAPVSNIRAQEDSARRDIGSIMLSDGAVVMHDAGKVFGAALHFNERQWLVTGAILAGTAVFFTIDESTRSLAMRNHSAFGDDLFGYGREYGREVYGLSASAGLYLGGLVFRDEDVRVTGVMLFESIAMAGIITSVLKSILGRSRPYTEEGPSMFRPLQFHTETTSLPSGHTTVAFAVSSVLAGRLKNIFASIALYSAATVTAMSRVYHDAHWVSDNILAAAIGTCVGLALVDLRGTESESLSIQFMPERVGIMVEWVF